MAKPQPLKVSPAEIRLKDGVFITKSDPAKQASFIEVTGRMGWRKRRHLVIGKGKRLDNPKGRKADIFGAHFVEVEVDTATGSVRVALGEVAPLQLRVKKAERALIGKKITSDILQQAADLATSGAQPLTMNRYKVDLTGALVKKAVLAVV